MEKQTRRRFLKQTPLFVAAVSTAGASCADPTTANAMSQLQDNTTTALTNVRFNGPIIIEIPDANKGEIVVLFNSQEIVVKNNELVKSILQGLR